MTKSRGPLKSFTVWPSYEYAVVTPIVGPRTTTIRVDGLQVHDGPGGYTGRSVALRLTVDEARLLARDLIRAINGLYPDMDADSYG